MSNIIKWNYINFEGKEKHIVDSDHSERIKETILGDVSQGLIGGIHIQTPQEIADAFLHQKEDGATEFVDGMNVINYDKMMEEKKERIAKQADSLLSDARKQAEAILEDARAQAESVRAQAYEEGQAAGYEAGLLEGQEVLTVREEGLSRMEQELLDRQDALEQDFMAKQKQMEPFFVELSMHLLEKMTGVLSSSKEDIILHLIQQGIEELGQSRQFCIHVSKEDMPFVNEEKERILSKLPKGCELEIMQDESFTKNQCIIEADKKMIDSSLDIQLRNLIEDLRLLSV